MPLRARKPKMTRVARCGEKSAVVTNRCHQVRSDLSLRRASSDCNCCPTRRVNPSVFEMFTAHARMKYGWRSNTLRARRVQLVLTDAQLQSEIRPHGPGTFPKWSPLQLLYGTSLTRHIRANSTRSFSTVDPLRSLSAMTARHSPRRTITAELFCGIT